MAKDMVTVSVIIPVYNCESYLRQTMDSVLDQDFSDIELVLVDDCSTDSSYAIAREYEARDARVKTYRNDANLGVSETRNRGIQEAKGKYIALLDGDDIWTREKLSRQISLIEEKDADLVYCSYGFLDEKGNKIKEPFIVPEETDFDKFLVSSVISCSTAMARAEIFKNNPFRKDYYHEDYLLWVTLLKNGCKVCGDRKVLAYYRQHESSRAGNKWKAAKERWVIFRKALGLPVKKSIKSFLAYSVNGIIKYSK